MHCICSGIFSYFRYYDRPEEEEKGGDQRVGSALSGKIGGRVEEQVRGSAGEGVGGVEGRDEITVIGSALSSDTQPDRHPDPDPNPDPNPDPTPNPNPVECHASS